MKQPPSFEEVFAKIGARPPSGKRITAKRPAAATPQKAPANRKTPAAPHLPLQKRQIEEATEPPVEEAIQKKPRIESDKRLPYQVLGRTGFKGPGQSVTFHRDEYEGSLTKAKAAAEKWLQKQLKSWQEAS